MDTTHMMSSSRKSLFAFLPVPSLLEGSLSTRSVMVVDVNGDLNEVVNNHSSRKNVHVADYMVYRRLLKRRVLAIARRVQLIVNCSSVQRIKHRTEEEKVPMKIVADVMPQTQGGYMDQEALDTVPEHKSASRTIQRERCLVGR
jgi:hypothetical protein